LAHLAHKHLIGHGVGICGARRHLNEEMEVVAHKAESKHTQATELLVATNELEELLLFVITEDESAITDAADDMVSPAVGEGIRDKETGKAHDEGSMGQVG
jgi:hypothetical protein